MSCFRTDCCHNEGEDNRIFIIERGPRGPRGYTGQQGLTGATGPQGPRGFTGATGATGATGPQGPIGPVGPQGPQGEAGTNGLASYGGLYSTSTTGLSLTDTPTARTLPTAMPQSNVTYGTNSIMVQNAGDFEINYGTVGSASPTSLITLSVQNNGVDLPASVKSNTYNGSDDVLSGTFIATLAAGDVITLNMSAATDTTFSPQDGANSYLTVKQLSTTA